MFTGASTKFSIGSLDSVDLEVDAQFNPKELQFDRSVQWDEHLSVKEQSANKPAQEYTAARAESVKVDLLFDGFENGGKLHSHLDAMGTVESNVRKLRELAAPNVPIYVKMKNGKNTVDHNRPHYCVATWGSGTTKMPRFECVIESVSVKYQAFADDGTVLRALVTLGLKAAGRANVNDMQPDDTKARAKRAQARSDMRDSANMDRATRETSSYQERGLQWRGQNRRAEKPDQTETFLEEDNSFSDREKVANDRQEEAAKREEEARKAGRGRPELKPY